MFDAELARQLKWQHNYNVELFSHQLRVHRNGISDTDILIPPDFRQDEIADAIDESAYSTNDIAGYIVILLTEIENLQKKIRKQTP